jgi:hypothetical protein
MSCYHLNKKQALNWIESMRDKTTIRLEDFKDDKENRYFYTCLKCGKYFKASSLIALLKHTCNDAD